MIDGSARKIIKTDSAGDNLLSFGSYGNGNGQFSAPEQIAVDSSGDIYVLDRFNINVQKI